MKKKHYIAPSLEVENIGSLNAQMLGELLGSPTNIQPGQHMPLWRPKNPTRTPVF